MGQKFKFSYYALVPVERSELLEIVNAFENAIHLDEPTQAVTITINGNKNSTIQLTSEKLVDIVEIMKFAFSEE